jgi:hypothetical protein
MTALCERAAIRHGQLAASSRPEAVSHERRLSAVSVSVDSAQELPIARGSGFGALKFDAAILKQPLIGKDRQHAGGGSRGRIRSQRIKLVNADPAIVRHPSDLEPRDLRPALQLVGIARAQRGVVFASFRRVLAPSVSHSSPAVRCRRQQAVMLRT